jgi:hypothetical protein
MKPSVVKIVCLIMLIFGVIKINSVLAQSNISAIDILMDPDRTMLDSAKVYNGKMQQNYSGPGSYSLDELHKPHITVLQCFVNKADLAKVYTAVEKVVKSNKPTKEKLQAKGLYYFPYQKLGLAGINIDPSPGLLSFQSKIIEALRPFFVTGTNAAFVQNANGDPIAKGSEEYVNRFEQDHAGTKYNPHVTIGLAQEEYLKVLLAAPFPMFSFRCSAVSIYQLGDFGTARNKLWTSVKK